MFHGLGRLFVSDCCAMRWRLRRGTRPTHRADENGSGQGANRLHCCRCCCTIPFLSRFSPTAGMTPFEPPRHQSWLPLPARYRPAVLLATVSPCFSRLASPMLSAEEHMSSVWLPSGQERWTTWPMQARSRARASDPCRPGQSEASSSPPISLLARILPGHRYEMAGNGSMSYDYLCANSEGVSSNAYIYPSPKHLCMGTLIEGWDVFAMAYWHTE